MFFTIENYIKFKINNHSHLILQGNTWKDGTARCEIFRWLRFGRYASWSGRKFRGASSILNYSWCFGFHPYYCCNYIPLLYQEVIKRFTIIFCFKGLQLKSKYIIVLSNQILCYYDHNLCYRRYTTTVEKSSTPRTIIVPR